MPLGTFTLTIDGERQDGTAETKAKLHLRTQGVDTLIDADADEFKFPTQFADGRGVNVSLPYSIDLFTDTASGEGESTSIGYEGWVRTDQGRVDFQIAAQEAGATVSLTDLVDTVVVPVSTAQGYVLEAETAATAAETARDEATASAAAASATLSTLVLPGVVADGVTDNSAVFNSLTTGAGRFRLPKGPVLCKSPIVIPKNTEIQGHAATTAANSTGSSIPQGIVFDSTTIMSGGNSATVAADGTNWTFTVPAGHGLAAGNTFTAYGFTNVGFNVSCEIASVTSTTLVVTNATVPAASDSGSIGVHLIRIGSYNANTSDALLSNVWVECRNIPGSIAVFSSSVQEHGGLDRVTIVRPRYRGVLMDGTVSGPNNLNYMLRDIRTVASDNALADYRGIHVRGNNTSMRGAENLTCVGGGTGANLPAAQVQIDGCRTGDFAKIHCENAVDGVLIGSLVSCIGLQVRSVTGHSTITNSVVKIAAAATGTNQQNTLSAIMPNGAPKGIDDATSGYAAVSPNSHVGLYTTDTTGKVRNTTALPGEVTTTLASDTSMSTSFNSTLLTMTLPVGRWAVHASVTVAPATGTTSIELTNVVGTATAGLSGQRAAVAPINGTNPVSVPMVFVADVTVEGTVIIRGKSGGVAGSAKATAPVGGTAGATSAVATRIT